MNINDNKEILIRILTKLKAARLSNSELKELRVSMKLPRRELKTISVMWNSGISMTKAEITQALYPIFPAYCVKRNNKRIAKRIKSLVEKNAVVVDPDCMKDGEETYVPVYSRAKHIEYIMGWHFGKYRPKYTYKDVASAIRKFFRKLMKKDD